MQQKLVISSWSQMIIKILGCLTFTPQMWALANFSLRTEMLIWFTPPPSAEPQPWQSVESHHLQGRSLQVHSCASSCAKSASGAARLTPRMSRTAYRARHCMASACSPGSAAQRQAAARKPPHPLAPPQLRSWLAPAAQAWPQHCAYPCPQHLLPGPVTTKSPASYKCRRQRSSHAPSSVPFTFVELQCCEIMPAGRHPLASSRISVPYHGIQVVETPAGPSICRVHLAAPRGGDPAL